MSGLIFYMHDGPSTFRFELSGSLAGGEVAKLDQAWCTASSTIDEKILAVDVTFLASADDKGRALLTRWWHAGAHFVANSPLSRTLVESITGTSYAPADPAVGPTFDPRFTAVSLRAMFLALLFAATLLFPPTAAASDESALVLERYNAGLSDKSLLDRLPVSVEIDASVARLDKQAHVKAIRRLTEGRRKYQFVSVDGDSFVRNEMIARYFAIDTEAAPLAAPITKSNYKFRFVATQENAYVFQIVPRKKRQGMIEGELWIDGATGHVTHLAGRLVKSPSILLRHIDIWRETEIRDGAIFARETHLHIDTRFTGRAELTIRERSYTGGDSVAVAEVTENVTP